MRRGGSAEVANRRRETENEAEHQEQPSIREVGPYVREKNDKRRREEEGIPSVGLARHPRAVVEKRHSERGSECREAGQAAIAER